MRIETDSSENTITVILDSGFKVILTYKEAKRLKELISEVENDR